MSGRKLINVLSQKRNEILIYKAPLNADNPFRMCFVTGGMKLETYQKIFLILIIAAIAITCSTIHAGAQWSSSEEYHVEGIVKENNYSLGYITLYYEDGSGTAPDSAENLTALRTFTYGFNVTAIRDGYIVGIQNIQPGDRVFIRLDNDRYIEKISARSFYKPVYGTVHYKGVNWLSLKKEDGTFAYYSVPVGVSVYRNGKSESFSNISPGEKVKLLVQVDGTNIHIASIDIEKNPSFVTGIYRGRFEFFDTFRDALIVSNLQEFVNGQWKNSSFIGVKSIKFSEEYNERPARRAQVFPILRHNRHRTAQKEL